MSLNIIRGFDLDDPRDCAGATAGGPLLTHPSAILRFDRNSSQFYCLFTFRFNAKTTFRHSFTKSFRRPCVSLSSHFRARKPTSGREKNRLLLLLFLITNENESAANYRRVFAPRIDYYQPPAIRLPDENNVTYLFAATVKNLRNFARANI